MKLKIKKIKRSEFLVSEEYNKIFNSENCEFLQLSIKKTNYDEVKKSDCDKFLIACKKIIDSDICEEVLLSPSVMNLLPFCKKRGVPINKDGSRFIPDKDDKTITDKEDIEYRAILMFLFKSKISRMELKKRFKDIFLPGCGLYLS